VIPENGVDKSVPAFSKALKGNFGGKKGMSDTTRLVTIQVGRGPTPNYFPESTARNQHEGDRRIEAGLAGAGKTSCLRHWERKLTSLWAQGKSGFAFKCRYGTQGLNNSGGWETTGEAQTGNRVC